MKTQVESSHPPQTETGKNPVGRPSKFYSINKKQLKKLAEAGFTEEQICNFFEIPMRTFCNWKEKHQKFWQVLKDWKAEADKKVEKSLYQRACGYSCQEDKIFLGVNNEPIIVPTIKHYPPDPTSMIFWLKNRQPKAWRDKTETEHSGDVNFNLKSLIQDVNRAEKTNNQGMARLSHN